ncbi:MAG: NADPH:quinone reductase-like Zn-dependent oxidoreductase/3-oxoacyl-(acyl-carrier-protein) synthase/malonyl CoA-acyl carrier protein transacylase, partial [Myxococcota bacterium]
ADADLTTLDTAPLWGLGQTLVVEHPELRCLRVDVGGVEDAEALVAEVFCEGAEDQVVLRGERRWVARLVPTTIGDATLERRTAPGTDYQLCIDTPGMLDTLCFRALPPLRPGPGEVLVAVEASGLNFLDVLTAMGLIEDGVLGGELVGRVLGLGEGVEGLSVGQRIIGLSLGGAFASQAIVSASLVVPLPDNLDPTAAATLPIVHLTTYISLHEVARLSAGERILIHSAAGGVGQAAIQWARHVGAEIYATAGTPEKRQWLADQGIRFVADSRSMDWVASVMAWTDGEGVDVVLNSLAGEAIPAGIGVLRDHGRFIEIGKRDLQANRPVGLRPFLKNLSLSVVDVRGMIQRTPGRIRALLSEILEHVRLGHLHPLPHTVTPIAEAGETFRHMARGLHRGKLVLSGGEPVSVVVEDALDLSGTWLVTGGLGGLGLSVASWLAEQGASLLLIGRRGAHTEAQKAAVEAMRALGVSVSVAAADVSDEAALRAAIGDHTLSGVVHAAGLLDDAMLLEQNRDRFRAVSAPKITGAALLHRLTADHPIRHFVLYGSAASLVGSPGQANYAGANAFLSALSLARQAAGLPAMTLCWGPFSEVGLAAAEANRGARLGGRGLTPMSPGEGLEVLETALSTGRPLLGALRWDVRQWLTFYPRLVGAPWLSTLSAGAQRSTGDEALLTRLRQTAAPARIRMMMGWVAAQAGQVLRIAPDRIDRDQALTDQGIDSLMSLELRNRLEAGLGMSLSATLLWAFPTLQSLSEHLVEQLPDTDTDTYTPATPQPPAPAVLEEVVTPPIPATPATPTPLPEDRIAIVGVGCRFPGGSDGPERFWSLLSEGRDGIIEIPHHRWVPTADAPPATRWGGFLDRVDQFDAAFFSITPREAEALDPQQRLLLEVSWEALEDAGLPAADLVGTVGGVYVGLCNQDWQHRVWQVGAERMDAYCSTGSMTSVAAGRVAYALGLTGPTMTVDTACSSSLTAIHLAASALRSGECDLALAGGVNLILDETSMRLAASLQALSPDGRCKTFDASANGFVRGEGCGVVVLKRLSDALSAGDRIWGVIAGSAVNQDGRSAGLTAPSRLAQERLLKTALKRANLAPEDIGYIEAHGTGTSLGDPIEVEAISNVFAQGDAGKNRQSTCFLGAVKSNIGHLEAAAGIAGIIKVLLAFKHHEIPKNLHFSTLNPKITPSDTLTVVAENTPWPRGNRPRTAGVSGFGISGTNAHVILQEHVQKRAAPAALTLPALLPISARTPQALQQLATGWREALAAHDLSDVLSTAAHHRSPLSHRAVVVVSDLQSSAAALDALAAGEVHEALVTGASPSRPGAVFVFPGQGSQWVGMGVELYDSSPVFAAALDEVSIAIEAEAGFSVVDVLHGPVLSGIAVIQPVLFSVMVALAKWWMHHGIEPVAVIGHSQGEIAAAHIAGILSLQDAARIICRRSKLLTRIAGQGGMALVELSESDARETLSAWSSELSVAVVNSDRSTVVSGSASALSSYLDSLPLDVYRRRVKVDIASHSPQVDVLLSELVEVLGEVTGSVGRIPLISTVTGDVVSGEAMGASYWADNLRHPVRFSEAVGRMLSESPLFIEVSPHPILTPAIKDAKAAVIHSLYRERPQKKTLFENLARA